MHITARNHTIEDTNTPFEVDPVARKVVVPYAGRVIGVIGDHRSEQVTFKMPQIIDGHNMTTCNRKYVAWRNVLGELGTDGLEIVEERENFTIYGWTVRDALTKEMGLVEFSLHFECDGPETGKKIYSWGTHTCSECEILDSVNSIIGAYAALYIDGETLVFGDYTPVHNNTLELESGIIPEGTLTITEAGKHDVARYAYAEVKKVFTAPTITFSEGKVTASANGLKTEVPLIVEELVKRSPVRLTHSKEGIIKIQSIDRADNSINYTEYDLERLESPIDFTPVAGSTMHFIASDNTSIELYDYSGEKPRKVGLHLTGFNEGFSHVFWTVPLVEENTSVALTLYVNPWPSV